MYNLLKSRRESKVGAVSGQSTASDYTQVFLEHVPFASPQSQCHQVSVESANCLYSFSVPMVIADRMVHSLQLVLLKTH